MLPAPRPCGGAAAPAAVLPPLRRCCRPCGMAFPQRNNKKCPSPPFQETETLKLLPSDSCSPCAKHFLTATNLGLSSIFYRTAPEKSIFFCRTSQFFCRPSALLYLPPAGRAPRPRARVTFGRSDLPAFLFCASGGPISSSSGRNGGKNAAKTNGFWNSFHPIAVAVQKGSATNRLCVYPRCRWHGTQRAMVALPFGRLSNRALAASGGKCRCGPLGRAPERGTFLLKINQRVAAGGA